MSGICGVISFNPLAPVDGIDRMAGAAPYRGPDGVGVWRGEGAVLTHQALHVTPESRHEEQPLVDEEAGLVLVADARIDNRDELQRTLRRDLRRSVRHDVITDADLILAAYRRWGTDCAAHLLGDFAFAVWDRHKRQLFAARDPMAMRPFYYRIEGGRVLFGSEVKQILAAPGVSREVFELMVARYLCGRYEPLNWTFFEGIAQLPPGKNLIVDSSGRYHTRQYWALDPASETRYRDEKDYARHFRHLFKDAVRCRIRSQVPVGLFLSGGVDSGSIASMVGFIKEADGTECPDFRTYSWAFCSLTQCDERHVSDEICSRYNLKRTYIDAEAGRPLTDHPQHGPDLDTPYHGIYQALLERGNAIAHQDGVRLLMSGDRGDLMVGEYIYDYAGLFWRVEWPKLISELRTQSKWRGTSLPKELRRHLLRPAFQYVWPQDRWTGARKVAKRLYHTLKGLPKASGTPVPLSYPSWIDESFAKRNNLAAPIEPHTRSQSGLPTARANRQAAILNTMQMRGMTWTNRMHARHETAFADPWSDRRIAEFVFSVPQRVLNETGNEKKMVRRAMEGIMPEAALSKTKKVSLGPLYSQSIREKHTDDIMRLLKNMASADRGFVDEAALRDMYRSVQNGGSSGALWQPLALEMWLRAHW